MSESCVTPSWIRNDRVWGDRREIRPRTCDSPSRHSISTVVLSTALEPEECSILMLSIGIRPSGATLNDITTPESAEARSGSPDWHDWNNGPARSLSGATFISRTGGFDAVASWDCVKQCEATAV